MSLKTFLKLKMRTIAFSINFCLGAKTLTLRIDRNGISGKIKILGDPMRRCEHMAMIDIPQNSKKIKQ
jgi:hypothetical protein